MNSSRSLHLHDPVKGPGTVRGLFVLLGLAMFLALQFPSHAIAQTAATANCGTALGGAPTEQAVVSAASSALGNVLVVGSGAYEGCSLYIVSSDAINPLTDGAVPFACSDGANVLGPPCAAALWPALLTKGAPRAGAGVNPKLLGAVTRTDVLTGQSVQQVTYAGLPLYRFTLDDTPGDIQGANLFDSVTSPAGIWYLVEPDRGHPATGQARLVLETAPINGTGPEQTVLAVKMDPGVSDIPPAQNSSFPVYTLSAGTDEGQGNPWGHANDCRGLCSAVPWPPVLTSMFPEAGTGVSPRDLGTIERPDGTRQVTYKGQPLYLFWEDAYIAGVPVTGSPGIHGQGKTTAWGVFNTISPSR